MPFVTDQMGRMVEIPASPKRIISLVPSQSELLFDLGLAEDVVGLTHFCVHPKTWHDQKTKIGGTKKLNVDTIDSLQPDLIIGNKEENRREDIEVLEKKYPVWMSDIRTMDDALEMIERIGDLVGRSHDAKTIINEIQQNFTELDGHTVTRHDSAAPRVLYFIWRNPYMAAGPTTFIHDILIRCGLANVFHNGERYPEVPMERLRVLNPEVVLLSSEPYPFKEKHISELAPHLPDSKILLVDGEMFSWYGSRLRLAPTYLRHLLDSV